MRKILPLLALIVLASCSSDAESEADLSDMSISVPIDYPEIVNGTFEFQSREREYTLHIPDTHDGTEPAPLVVFLHGEGQNSESAQAFTEFNTVSEENGFLMLYPQATLELETNGLFWEDGIVQSPANQNIDDVGYINALVESLKSEYNIDPKKIYLCGFSNGGFLTQRIAFEDNSQFAAMGTINATLEDELKNNSDPGRPISMVYIFGDQNTIVPYDGGFVSYAPNSDFVLGIDAAVDFWATYNNCELPFPGHPLIDLNQNDNSTATVIDYTNGTDGSGVTVYFVYNGGHTWPGVLLDDQESIGATNLDFMASQVLWDFFDQFELVD